MGTSANSSIDSAGGLVGALLMYPALELLGRRMTVIIADTIFIIGAIMCTVPTHQLGLIYAGRFFTGMGVGGIAAVSPIYIAEISPPAIRGRLTGFFESFYQTGAVIGFWINYGIVHNMDRTKSMAWRIPMAVQLIPAGLLALMIPFLKESPVWLLKRGRDADALKVYSFFRNLPADHEYIQQDVQFVKLEIAKERAHLVGDEQHATFGHMIKSAAKEGSMKGMRNRFLLVFLMFMWQAWSGAAAINYYSPTIFTSIGLSDVTLWTGVYGIIKAGGLWNTEAEKPFISRRLTICQGPSSSLLGSLTSLAANGLGSSPLSSALSANTIWLSTLLLEIRRLDSQCPSQQWRVARLQLL